MDTKEEEPVTDMPAWFWEALFPVIVILVEETTAIPALRFEETLLFEIVMAEEELTATPLVASPERFELDTRPFVTLNK